MTKRTFGGTKLKKVRKIGFPRKNEITWRATSFKTKTSKKPT